MISVKTLSILDIDDNSTKEQSMFDWLVENGQAFEEMISF